MAALTGCTSSHLTASAPPTSPAPNYCDVYRSTHTIIETGLVAAQVKPDFTDATKASIAVDQQGAALAAVFKAYGDRQAAAPDELRGAWDDLLSKSVTGQPAPSHARADQDQINAYATEHCQQPGDL